MWISLFILKKKLKKSYETLGQCIGFHTVPWHGLVDNAHLLVRNLSSSSQCYLTRLVSDMRQI